MKLDSVGTLFSKAWDQFVKRFDTAAKIFLVPLVFIVLSRLLLEHRTSAALGLGGLLAFIGGLASVVAAIALISAFGKGTDFNASYRNGFHLFWSYIWVAILTCLAVLGGFVMLIIPGIMLIIQLSFMNYAMVLDGKRGFAALAQSREYVKGYWWAVLGRTIILVAIFFVAMLLIYQPFQILFGLFVGSLVYGLLLLILTPFAVAYQYELFENFRRLKPDAGEAAAKAEGGFLKVAVVVGIVGAVALTVLIIIGIVGAVALAPRGMDNSLNGYHSTTSY